MPKAAATIGDPSTTFGRLRYAIRPRVPAGRGHQGCSTAAAGTRNQLPMHPREARKHRSTSSPPPVFAYSLSKPSSGRCLRKMARLAVTPQGANPRGHAASHQQNELNSPQMRVASCHGSRDGAKRTSPTAPQHVT
eukprot:scaffold179587_cov29-Tisochrysis_lutea.AAC.3